MINPMRQEHAKHWFVIDRRLKGSLQEWLLKCPNPTFCVGRTVGKPSNSNQQQCGFEISDGDTPETAEFILLQIYTDVPTLNDSFLGALRDLFKPFKSSEPMQTN